MRAPALALLASTLLSAPQTALATDALVERAAPGPWPVASRLIAYRGRIWFACSVKGVNHNAAPLWSIAADAPGEPRFERPLFSQDAGEPIVADGLLYWPHEDPRASPRFGHVEITDGADWALSTIPTGLMFHVHAITADDDGTLYAATSAWTAGVERSRDRGVAWERIYAHTPEDGGVARIVDLAIADGALWAYMLAPDGPRLLTLIEERAETAPGWPAGARLIAMTEHRGALIAALRLGDRAQFWRFSRDGAAQALAAPLEGWRPVDLESDGARLVALARNGGGARLYESADGVDWATAGGAEGLRPVDLLLHDGAYWVGGERADGRCALFGPSEAIAAADLAPPPPLPRPGPIANEEARAAALAELDAALDEIDRGATIERLRLRDAVYALAQHRGAGALFRARHDAERPAQEMRLFGERRTDSRPVVRSLLLWGMALAGEGGAPATAIRAPFRSEPNGAEKYLDPAPLAAWVALLGDQTDPATLAALEAPRPSTDPDWLVDELAMTARALRRAAAQE